MSLYHEKQLSALCGCHALNNLLQAYTVGAGDLAALAHGLDAQERALLGEGQDVSLTSPSGRSHRVDVNTGDFSVDVLAAALEERCQLQLVNVDHVSVAEAVSTQPEAEEGYLIHQGSHWFGLRRVASMWWNVDSKLPRPMLVGEEHLGPFIAKLRMQGCTVFAVRGGALPLPSPSASGGAGHESVFHPIDYLLEYPPLDPSTYRASDFAYLSNNPDAFGGMDDEDAAAAAALAATDEMQESERAVAALQAQEWAGGAHAGAPLALARLHWTSNPTAAPIQRTGPI